MGTWSASITGNDTARDLMQEYTVAFYKFPVEEALEKLDVWVRAHYCNESDPEDWVNYYYSLADFMWKKGILPDHVRDRAIEMIDSRFGMELWEEDKSALLQREKVLAKFREKLLSPQPPKKRIKPNVHMSPIFQPGDLIAVQLQTAGKPYIKKFRRIAPEFDFTDEEFHALDGKYVLIQLIECRASWSSAFDPEIKDWWAYFRLFEGIYDAPPPEIDPDRLSPVLFTESGRFCGQFICESSIFWFKKRNYVLLGNTGVDPDRYMHTPETSVFWGINKPWTNPDSDLITAMGKKITVRRHEGELKPLDELCRISVGRQLNDAGICGLKNWDQILEKKDKVSAALQLSAEQGNVYRIDHDGNPMGVLGITGQSIRVFCMSPFVWGLGYDEELLRFVLAQTTAFLTIAINTEDQPHRELLERCGFRESERTESVVMMRFDA